jgi:hypothetical protein
VAQGTREASVRAVARAALAVQTNARRRAPVDHGRLRQSIGFEMTAAPSAFVGVGVPYARYVIEGTGIYGPRGEPIRPNTKPTLVFKSKSGVTVYAKQVKGQRPNKFLVEALRETLA